MMDVVCVAAEDTSIQSLQRSRVKGMDGAAHASESCAGAKRIPSWNVGEAGGKKV
jgi:hypothetical protein